MTRGKIIALVLGLILLVGSGVVVGLTVIRIQNERATITQPKAADSQCNSQPGCCSQIASGGGFDKCGWPDRGWCTLSQCEGSDSSKTYDCNRGGGPRNCNCGLFVRNYCQSPPPTTGNGNPCFANVPIPKDGQPTGSGVSLTPTFSWSYNTTWSSNVYSLGVYLFSCPARNDTCLLGAVYGPRTLANLSDFSNHPTLSQNTTYYWGVTVNSYYPPAGDPKWDCMPKWQFTTGVGTATHLGCVDKTCTVVTGAGGNTEGCQTAGTACTGGACTTDTGCPTGQKCVNGTCTTSTTHYGCVNKTCAVVSGATSNANGCTATGGTCCASNSDCSSDQTCETTKTPNSCSVSGQVGACWGNEGANGKCYDCNGDGVINILDFSCFAKKWLQNI